MKYNDYTKLQLIELCKTKNIKNYSKLNKEQLIKLLHRSKTGGTKENMNNYIKKRKNQLDTNTTTNENARKSALFGQLTFEISTNKYFDLLSYFNENGHENKDFLDFIIEKMSDDLQNFINYKSGKVTRPFDRWEYVTSIIKKEKTISLFDFFIIWTQPYCEIYNKDKINYYKTIIQEIKNFKNNNQSKNFDDFMEQLKTKLNSNNNNNKYLKEIFKPYLTENLSSRIQKIKEIKKKNNKNLFPEKSQKSINYYKTLNSNFKYIELEKDHFIYNQLKNIWYGIDKNKSFIELVTGISYNGTENINNTTTLYKIGNKIYLSSNDFMKAVQENKELKFVYDESIKIMKYFNIFNNRLLYNITKEIYENERNKNLTFFTNLYAFKYMTIKSIISGKYKNLFSAFYNHVLGSNNIGRFLNTKNKNTTIHRSYDKFHEFIYYCNQSNYNSDFLYKMWLINKNQLIPDIRVKYYKKLYEDMNLFLNKNSNKNFEKFMLYFKNNIIYNNFKLDKVYQVYITKFSYCGKNKEIDTIYKDLQNNTALYKKWKNIYNLIKKYRNLELIDIILCIEFTHNFNNELNIKTNSNYLTINKINNNTHKITKSFKINKKNIKNKKLTELYKYQKPDSQNQNQNQIRITEEVLNNQGEELRKKIIDFDTLTNEIEYLLKTNKLKTNKNIDNFIKKNNNEVKNNYNK